jgi:hypothetical protein
MQEGRTIDCLASSVSSIAHGELDSWVTFLVQRGASFSCDEVDGGTTFAESRRDRTRPPKPGSATRPTFSLPTASPATPSASQLLLALLLQDDLSVPGLALALARDRAVQHRVLGRLRLDRAAQQRSLGADAARRAFVVDLARRRRRRPVARGAQGGRGSGSTRQMARGRRSDGERRRCSRRRRLAHGCEAGPPPLGGESPRPASRSPGLHHGGLSIGCIRAPSLITQGNPINVRPVSLQPSLPPCLGSS